MMCAAYPATYGSTTNECKPSESTLSLEEQLRISSSQFDQLERENARVVIQLKEVIKMNSHWQRYDSQREEYVLKLTRTNQELQDQVINLQRQEFPITSAIIADCTRPADSNYICGAADTTQELSAEPSSSSTNREDEIAALTDHINQLEDKIVALERGRASRNKTDDDELAMLREQINVCVEDFKQERKDRERIHSENQRLRERLVQSEQIIRKNEDQMLVYQGQIKRLQEKCQLRPVSQFVPTNGRDEPCCFPEERPRQHLRSPHTTRKTFRHPIYLGDDLTDLPRDVEIDGVPDESEDVPDGHLPIGAEALIPDEVTEKVEEKEEEDEPLQCPRCLASFSINRHGDLLDHINVCMD